MKKIAMSTRMKKSRILMNKNKKKDKGKIMNAYSVLVALALVALTALIALVAFALTDACKTVVILVATISTVGTLFVFA